MHNPTAGCVNAVCDPSQDELFSSMMLLANYALQVTWLPAWAWTAETCLRVPPPPNAPPQAAHVQHRRPSLIVLNIMLLIVAANCRQSGRVHGPGLQ